MLKTKRMIKLKFGDVGEFQESRDNYSSKFDTGSSMFKRRITQGVYWTSLDKDLACQVLRDERWFCGVKFWDAIKTIDNGAEGIKSNNVGFIKPKV